jgi:hypothetical protein
LLNPNLKGMSKKKIQMLNLPPKWTMPIRVLGTSMYILLCFWSHWFEFFLLQIIF